MTRPISRRTVLKGLGTAVALPFLEAMVPAIGRAAPVTGVAPKRMAFFYVPNGVNLDHWVPKEVGEGFTLPTTLEPLEAFRKEFSVLSGLTLDGARPHGDGGGDHARAMASFLTGAHPKKTHGADIKTGVSVDQVAAQRVGLRTRFPSLELGLERGAQAGNCDSGYSCAYSSNLSWRGEATPNAKEVDPRQVFDRLFASSSKDESDAARAKRLQYKKSILDFVQDDATSLKGQLGSNDQRKLDEYLSALRELEVRLDRVEKAGPAGANAVPTGNRPSGIPKEFEDHARLMMDLLVTAFQGDVTRIATLAYANDGSNRSYRSIGAPEGHHDLSHHGKNKEKLEKLAKINRFHIQQFAYLMEKLKGIPEGDGTLLDNCMLVYGSGISDGDRHNHDDLPILLAGKGGGALRSGRHVVYKKETPLSNLYVSMLDWMGTPVEKFGDSTGVLECLYE
jgi:hypothetical protein